MVPAIVIKGAREHNLKDLTLTIPRHKFVVITGLSGSGKSSLAFDTLYAEGQRRYLESLSAYARQFLEQMKKPAVDEIDGLSPAISIEQKYLSRNPRSTVGTVTEIYDFLRLLFARVGLPHCVSCGKPIATQTIQQIVDQIVAEPEGLKFAVLAPIARGKKGEYQKELSELRSRGFIRARIDGEEVNLSTPVKLKKTLRHDISISIDRLVLKPGIGPRLAEALEIATQLSGGLAEVEYYGESRRRFFSTRFACPDCGISFPELEPRSFSFNSPHGACPRCDGVGSLVSFDESLVIPNPSLSLNDDAIKPWEAKPASWKTRIFSTLGNKYGFDPNTPFVELPEKIKKAIIFGSGSESLSFQFERKGSSHTVKQRFPGVLSLLSEDFETASPREQEELGLYQSHQTCPTCEGGRLKKEMMSVFVGEKNIAEICSLSIGDCKKFLQSITFSRHQLLIAKPILTEIENRLNFLHNVGLDYLSLSRSAGSLSGGESQRTRLATQIGSNLVGVLYILDEPSIGLHQRDNDKLIKTLLLLRDLGNSVIVVEHDRETIERADHVIDLGPGAGHKGGYLVFEGPPQALREYDDSLTGLYLAGKRVIPTPKKRRMIESSRSLVVTGAKTNNLKNLTVKIPLGTFVCVTGVSGSGKSSLVIDTLLPALEKSLLGHVVPRSVKFDQIYGLEHINKAIHVDQAPIGRTPRSNPATYTGLFTEIRTLFAGVPEARVRGYTPSRFSFNVPGGRCETCSGDGTIKISMHFLPDVFVECEICRGKRYNRETLEILYRGKNIADVLSMTIEDACEFFGRVPSLRGKLQTLLDVGMGYVELGQNAVTLSGGEAQRIKLARELSRRSTGQTLYVLDEPTTGLHFEDIRKLMAILHGLVDQGNTVIVIEHNLDVIKQADHIVDLGPEGGDAGGQIVFEGTPEQMVKSLNTHTGTYLEKALD